MADLMNNPAAWKTVPVLTPPAAVPPLQAVKRKHAVAPRLAALGAGGVLSLAIGAGVLALRAGAGHPPAAASPPVAAPLTPAAPTPAPGPPPAPVIVHIDLPPQPVATVGAEHCVWTPNERFCDSRTPTPAVAPGATIRHPANEDSTRQ